MLVRVQSGVLWAMGEMEMQAAVTRRKGFDTLIALLGVKRIWVIGSAANVG
ncbi:MAG: hypothetical protein KAJ19_22145 [Gammaproteobacteria bacterium]|nr:hypothetical protein [Gammaproteobacteria bacterium]